MDRYFAVRPQAAGLDIDAVQGVWIPREFWGEMECLKVLRRGDVFASTVQGYALAFCLSLLAEDAGLAVANELVQQDDAAIASVIDDALV